MSKEAIKVALDGWFGSYFAIDGKQCWQESTRADRWRRDMEAALTAALPHLAKPSKSDRERAYKLWGSIASGRSGTNDLLALLAAVRAEASAAEREACAKVAEAGMFTMSVPGIAAAIRARKL